MCWNQYVSINTFVFGVFTLLLIAYNNKYSPYKIKEFDNIYIYFFFMSFITMQLFEFFLWRNINNTYYNHLFSVLGAFLIFIQPIASLTMIKDYSLMTKLITVYTIPALTYLLYDMKNKYYITSVSKTGHLKWQWTNLSITMYVVWLLFLLYSLYSNKYYSGLILALILFAYFYYLYYRDGSAGSLWCWSVNIFTLFFAIKILLYLPFKEHGLC